MTMKCWFVAAQNGRIDDIERLLKRGFKVNSKLDHEGTNIKGLTALYYAVDKAPSLGGCTPLYFVFGLGYLEIVKCLVEKGKADVDKAENDGTTPLYTASGKGELEVVKYLVEEGKAEVGKVASN